jgi:hypothetical protein
MKIFSRKKNLTMMFLPPVTAWTSTPRSLLSVPSFGPFFFVVASLNAPTNADWLDPRT